MKPEWKSFLQDAGAEFDEAGTVVTFGNPVRERRMALNATVFADLSHYGLVAAHGEDAEAFLQGQFSNDVRKVDEQHSLLNAYCSPKGRMLSNFRLFRHGDSFYLRMPEELVENTVSRLRMFVLMSKVTFDEAADTFCPIGVSGPEALEELAKATGVTPPDRVDAVVQTKEFVLIRVPGIFPRFELYANLEAAKRIWDALNVRCAPVGAGPWNLLELLAGVPTVYRETVEAFVPQMANMQLINGVNFQKGCYPGQEVVARMQYLGKLKRRMYLAHIPTEERPDPATELYDAKGDDQSCGRIVDAEPHPDGGMTALAVIQIASADGGDVRLGAKDGPTLELQPLPYSFEAA